MDTLEIFIVKTNKMEGDNTLFLGYINDHYKDLYYKYRQFCKEKQYEWDEDIFEDTILKCYETITKKGKLKDTSPQGLENYFFISFKTNIQREKQYARNMKRDLNYSTEKVAQAYEDWYNSYHTSSSEKLKSDLWKDFATLYIMTRVEEAFDSEHFYLFKLKHLCGLTYSQVCQRANIKGCRQKILEVKQWLKENITKDEIKDAYHTLYGDLL